MFNKKKKTYTLNDIEKLFTYIPAIFILFLAVLLLIISYFILEAKQERDIDLIQQKQILNYEFDKKDTLYKFVDIVESKVDEELLSVKEHLSQVIYKTIGHIDTKYDNKLDFQAMKEYLNRTQKNENIKFVVFEKETLDILYGHSSILNLQDVMFNHPNSEKFKELTLQYISSQGKNNFEYWKYDLQKNLILSFFDTFFIEGKEFYIGAFSTINNIKQITKQYTKKAIGEINSDLNYHIWFYDSNTKTVFNFDNNKRRLAVKRLLQKNNPNNRKYQILEYYKSRDDENQAFSKYVYFYFKYSYYVSISYDNLDALKVNKDEISTIEAEYKILFFRVTIFIILITAVLIFFSFLFSTFIKNIFGKYNLELSRKTTSLEHWKKRFELAIIASNDGLWDIDLKADKIYFSTQWLNMFGYEKGELTNFSDWFALIHKEDKNQVEEKFEKIFCGMNDSFVGEYRLKTKSSGYKWVFARGKIFTEENSGSQRMLMMSMDIDKNKKMIKELLDVELLVEDGRIVIFKCNNDKSLSVNYISNSIKTYGYSKNEFELKNIHFMNIVYEEDKNLLKVAIKAAILKELKSFSQVFRIINTGGEIRWVFLRAILLKDDFANVTQLYGYIHDITKIKVSEEELKVRVENEVKENIKKDRLLIQQSKLASMGEMLGNIAHQWRQPLNTVNLILHFLRDNYQNENFTKEKLEKYINKSKTQIDYMSQTIDDFRNFYKPSKTANEFNIKNAMKDVLKILKEQLEDDDIEVLFDASDIVITNYENELKQSLLNIINNAKDAIFIKREKNTFDACITIKVTHEAEFAKILLSNNGGVMEEDIMQRVFEPYFTTKFETQGTGIGLYMTKTIIETNMKGKIKVENIKDGVVFEILLPLETILKPKKAIDE
ncbi:MAG: PAS domain-containing protein [Campylobacteraceae bacterium]|nr:PAS domain-containing protein [Campylobacteraceae bacterium]